MNILITGAGGFSGKRLAKILSKDPANTLYLCDRVPLRKKNWITRDLSVPQHVDTMIDQIRPQQIYHLAGTFSNDFKLDFESNVLTTKNIFDALLRYQHRCRVLLVGSAAEYGMVAPEDNPISEQHPLNPISIYVLTKVYQTNLMKYYCVNHNLDIVMARTFNLLGRGQSDRLFIGRIYRQIDLFKCGKINKIVLGNMNNNRDYITINKAILYYINIMKFGNSGDTYNVGSGYPVQMYELLTRILNRSGMNINAVEINQQNIIDNKSDVQIIYADISKIKQLRR
jgi:GDP-4-dehydro-6-deoxy-D-mannose reductase